MSLKSYKYRIYPTKEQVSVLNRHMYLCKELYNIFLLLNKDQYKANGTRLDRTAMNLAITRIKELDTRFNEPHSQAVQNVSDRLNKAYINFFKRLEMRRQGKKIKAGFPRFKKFVSSLIYPQSGFKFLNHNTLYVSKVGNIKIRHHRPLEGTVKTMAIKKVPSGHWFVTFTCELGKVPVPTKNTAEIGIDMGLDRFATFSDGTKIENPRPLVKAQTRLKRLQRRASKRVLRSKNRRTANRLLAIQHERVANQRHDFHNKLARSIVDKFGFIAVEDLNISGMVKENRFARSIYDAGWGEFLRTQGHMAESAGVPFVRTPPEYSSGECSECGAFVEMALSDRVYRCPVCGLVLDRDVNSARVHLKRARAGHARSNARGDPTSVSWPVQDASRVDEPGTRKQPSNGKTFEDPNRSRPSGSP